MDQGGGGERAGPNYLSLVRECLQSWWPENRPGTLDVTGSPGRRWRGYLVTVIPLPSTTSPTTAAGVVCFSKARTSSSERVLGTAISNPPLVCGSKRGRRSSVATPSDHTVSFRYSRLPLRPPGYQPSAARDPTG